MRAEGPNASGSDHGLGPRASSRVPVEPSRAGDAPSSPNQATPPDLLDELTSWGLDATSGEQRFREMIDALPAAIYTTDAHGKITHFNPACEALCGRTPEVGSDYWCVTWKLFYPDGRPLPHDQCPMAIALKEARPVRGVQAIAERPDGTRVWFEPYPTPLFDGAGNLIGGINMLVDITERMQAEASERWNARRSEVLSRTAAQLLESDNPQQLLEELCRDILEFLDCHVFFNYLIDEPSGRLRLNAYAGIPEEEARRIEWLDFGQAVCGCAARDRERIVAERIFDAHDPRTELVKSYGVQAYCCHPMVMQGRLIGTLSFGARSRSRFEQKEIEVMRSVADLVAIAMNRIQAEQALRQSEERYRQTLSLMPAAVYSCDASGVITYFNE
ncbi:MAG TPA: PAS domain S-box protein, partial [Fimbriimonadaceae bacterium]|nr:PAS domain S-box protein [Fimbriimonadaceae bacterium]